MGAAALATRLPLTPFWRPVAVAADQIGQAASQDLPQPGGQLSLGLALAAELAEVAMCLEQRLLDQVGGVGLAARAFRAGLASNIPWTLT